MKSKFFSYILPAIVLTLLIVGMTLFTMLDAFVLDRAVADTTAKRDPGFTLRPPKPADEPDATTDAVTSSGDVPSSSSPITTEPPTTETPSPDYPIIDYRYYKDENIEITIDENYYLNKHGVETRYFVVDLKLSDIEYLRTFVSRNEDGEIEKRPVSDMALENDAVFAINGDYFSFRERGYVVRNYEVLRSTPRRMRDGFDDDALFLLKDGSFMMIDEKDWDEEFGQIPMDVYQCFSFGPRLVEGGALTVDEHDEVGQSAASNPRTAIGVVDDLHFKIVVSEGRLVKNDGLTLYELAGIMESLGCSDAYNLDGGSSTTLYFNGEVLNELSGKERNISDCIFINGRSYSEEAE